MKKLVLFIFLSHVFTLHSMLSLGRLPSNLYLEKKKRKQQKDRQAEKARLVSAMKESYFSPTPSKAIVCVDLGDDSESIWNMLLDNKTNRFSADDSPRGSVGVMTRPNTYADRILKGVMHFIYRSNYACELNGRYDKIEEFTQQLNEHALVVECVNKKIIADLGCLDKKDLFKKRGYQRIISKGITTSHLIVVDKNLEPYASACSIEELEALFEQDHLRACREWKESPEGRLNQKKHEERYNKTRLLAKEVTSCLASNAPSSTVVFLDLGKKPEKILKQAVKDSFTLADAPFVTFVLNQMNEGKFDQVLRYEIFSRYYELPTQEEDSYVFLRMNANLINHRRYWKRHGGIGAVFCHRHKGYNNDLDADGSVYEKIKPHPSYAKLVVQSITKDTLHLLNSDRDKQQNDKGYSYYGLHDALKNRLCEKTGVPTLIVIDAALKQYEHVRTPEELAACLELEYGSKAL